MTQSPKSVVVTTDAQQRVHLSEADRQVLASYLGGGEDLSIASMSDADKVSGEAFGVPVGMATDGTFIWSLAAAYYVTKYGLAPTDSAVLDAARSRNGVCPDLTPEEHARMREAVTVRVARPADCPAGDGFDPFRDDW